MITAIVQYRPPPTIDLDACAEHFRKIAPGFRMVQGLIRKQFIPGPSLSLCAHGKAHLRLHTPAQHLEEHWNVIQPEATKKKSKSKLPMFWRQLFIIA